MAWFGVSYRLTGTRAWTATGVTCMPAPAHRQAPSPCRGLVRKPVVHDACVDTLSRCDALVRSVEHARHATPVARASEERFQGSTRWAMKGALARPLSADWSAVARVNKTHYAPNAAKELKELVAADTRLQYRWDKDEMLRGSECAPRSLPVPS